MKSCLRILRGFQRGARLATIQGLGGWGRTDTETGRRGESWGCRYRARWFVQISSEHLGKMNVCESGGWVGLRYGKAGGR